MENSWMRWVNKVPSPSSRDEQFEADREEPTVSRLSKSLTPQNTSSVIRIANWLMANGGRDLFDFNRRQSAFNNLGKRPPQSKDVSQFEADGEEPTVSRLSKSLTPQNTSSVIRIANWLMANGRRDLFDFNRRQSAFNDLVKRPPQSKDVSTMRSGSRFWSSYQGFTLPVWLNPTLVKPTSQSMIPNKMDFSSIKYSLLANPNHAIYHAGSNFMRIVAAQTHNMTTAKNKTDTDLVAKVMEEQQSFFSKITKNC